MSSKVASSRLSMSSTAMISSPANTGTTISLRLSLLQAMWPGNRAQGLIENWELGIENYLWC